MNRLWSNEMVAPGAGGRQLVHKEIGWDFSSNLEDLNTGITEWVGRLAYRLMGR
jgi:hypothetical protein